MITVTHTKDEDGPVSYASSSDTICLGIDATMYVTGYDPPHYQLPAIQQCYCGYTLQQHKDMLPCDNLGLLNY